MNARVERWIRWVMAARAERGRPITRDSLVAEYWFIRNRKKNNRASDVLDEWRRKYLKGARSKKEYAGG